MAVDHVSSDQQPPKSRRVQFGLKTGFLFLTAVCVLLGWQAHRKRQIVEMVARYQAMMDLIELNMSVAPDNTSFEQSLAIRQDLARFQKRSRVDPAVQREALGRSPSATGPFRNWASYPTTLDVSEALVTEPAVAVGTRLLRHYETGLAEMGLLRTKDSPGQIATATWRLPGRDLQVVIDVAVDESTKRATARMKFDYNDSISIW